jgi:hypothetical protein
MSTKINIDKKLIEASDPVKEFDKRLQQYFGTSNAPKTPSLYGADKNKCMKWVRLQLEKLGFPIGTSSGQNGFPHAWEFFAGLADSKSGLGLIPNIGNTYNQDNGGMTVTKFRAIMKELKIPDGSLIFGHSIRSNFWKQSLEANKKINPTKEVRKKLKKFTTSVAKDKLGSEAENTTTHIGMWKNGHFYHNIQNCKQKPACGCGTLAVDGCIASIRWTGWWPFEEIARKKLKSL